MQGKCLFLCMGLHLSCEGPVPESQVNPRELVLLPACLVPCFSHEEKALPRLSKAVNLGHHTTAYPVVLLTWPRAWHEELGQKSTSALDAQVCELQENSLWKNATPVSSGKLHKKPRQDDTAADSTEHSQNIFMKLKWLQGPYVQPDGEVQMGLLDCTELMAWQVEPTRV